MPDSDHILHVRAVYDAVAEQYAQTVGTELTADFEGPIDRAFLTAFVEYVRTIPGQVADVGCGPGRVTAFLAAHGLEVVGVDVSSAMLMVARTAHPGIRFEDGRLASLPFRDESLRGLVCWYSIIHTPPEQLDVVFAELQRVLSDQGLLLLAFQTGKGEASTRDNAYGTGVSLTSYRHDPDKVADSLVAAWMEVRARAVRVAEFDHESTPQAFILARSVAPGR